LSVIRIFKVSVLHGGLALRQHLLAYPECAPEEAVRQLENGPIAYGRYDYTTALATAMQHGWDVFSLDDNLESSLRGAIASLAKRAKPFWARMATLGRERVLRLLDVDQEQCLQYAGLLDTPLNESSIKWWDDLAKFFRGQQEERRFEIGRQAEKLTIAYENARLLSLGIAEMPRWVALEDNTLGFDVVSFRKQGDQPYEIYIEVKGSAATPARFILTRNEWDKAESIGDRYFLYVWNIRDESLRIVLQEELSLHIPNDKGNGHWVTAEFINDELDCSAC
jgi:hypothetical protein